MVESNTIDFIINEEYNSTLRAQRVIRQGYGSWVAATIANGQVSSAEVDLGRDFDFLDIQIPTITSATLKVTVSETSGGTFRDLGNGVTTPTTTGAYHDVWRLGGYQYIKIVSSGAQGAERLIRVRGMGF